MESGGEEYISQGATSLKLIQGLLEDKDIKSDGYACLYKYCFSSKQFFREFNKQKKGIDAVGWVLLYRSWSS